MSKLNITRLTLILFLALSTVLTTGAPLVTADQSTLSAPTSEESSFVKMTATGTAIRVGNQILYFEGMTENEVALIRNNFLYGGVLYALINRLAKFSAMHTVGGSRTALLTLFPLLASTAFTGGAKIWYTLKNVKQIWDTGLWYTLPSLYWQFGGNQPASYAFAAGLAGIGYARDVIFQNASETNTQYIHVPLTGESSKQFVVKAIFPSEPGEQPMYEINHIGLLSPYTSQGEFSNLSAALGSLNVDRIYIQPRHERNKNLLTSYFYDPILEKTVTLELLDDFGNHTNSPWLIDAIFHKADRSLITSANSALSPQVIQTIAEAFNAYADRFICRKNHSEEVCARFWESAPGTYDYKTGQPIAALSSNTQTALDHSLFQFNSPLDGSSMSLKWSDGTFWPSLGMIPDDNIADPPSTQWLIPEWISNFMVAELAFHSRELGYATSKYATNKVLSLLPQPDFSWYVLRLRGREGTDTFFERFASGDNLFQATLNQPVSTNPAEVRLVGQIDAGRGFCSICLENNRPLVQIPACSHQFCGGCLDYMGRLHVNSNRYTIHANNLARRGPPQFNVSCPLCRGDVAMEVTNW